MKLKDNSIQEIDTALYQLEQKLKSNIRLTDVENSNASSAKINAVDKKLTEEIKDRQSADEKLQDNINKEIADRKDADAAIENAKQDKLIAGNNIQIDGNVISAISKEYTAEAPVKVTDGKISLDTVPVTKGGTGVTTQADINKAFIGNLEVGNADVTDSTEFVSSWVSDNGFSDPRALNKPYKRQFIKVWNYIKDKISSVLGLTSAKVSSYDFHLNNKDNPHSVTKSQVGLGSVVNTGDSATPVSGGTTKFTTGGAYTELNKKVDKVDGKGLSSNDFTNTYKDKLDNIDTTVTADSSNLVTSGAVSTSISNKANVDNTNYKTTKRFYGKRNGQYVKIGSIPISSGSVFYAALDIDVFSSSPVSNYPVGSIKLNMSSGSYSTAFNINGYSSIPLNDLTNDYYPRIVVEKTSTDYILYVVSSYGYLSIAVTEYHCTRYTRGNFEEVSTLSGTVVYDSTVDNQIIPLNGAIPVVNGGTGQTTATAAANAFINSLPVGTSVPVDDTYYISQDVADASSYDRRPVSKLWEYIKGKISSVLGLTKDNYGGKASTAGTADKARNMYSQTFDLHSLDKTKFYPLFCGPNFGFMEVAIFSENGASSAEYNQNRIHFDISTTGWSDTPFTLNIREYACYDNKEITIGCIGRGTQDGGWAIWLRGGRTYNCYTRNCNLSLKTSDYTYGNEVYTVGTNYYGGTNSNVKIEFTPQSTITNGAYSSRLITAPAFKATIGFFGNLTGNVSGKSSKSSFLDEYPGAGGTRPTSGNIVPKDATEYGGMRKDVVTSSMTDGGRPGMDGHLLTMFWDNSGRYDTQLFLTCEEPTALKVRVKDNTADYGPWVDVITSNNIGSQSVAKAGTADTASTAGSAGKLTTARKTYVTLGTASTTTTRDWSGDTTIPVDGVLQVEHGGTGANTAQGAANLLIDNLPASDNVPVDSDFFISQVVNGGPFIPGYERRPISKLWEYIKGKILQEGEDFGYNHVVYDGDSLLAWANCTDGSMKKVLIKSGTYNITKSVDFSKAGTGYVFAEQGAVINSHIPVAFTASSGKTVVYNLSVVCDGAANGDNSCAFSADNPESLILYNCSATYRTYTEIVNRSLFEHCTCYNCSYAFQNLAANSSISVKVFYQCRCYNCKCLQTIEANSSTGISFYTDSYFYRECHCSSCDAELTTSRNIKASTPTFACYYHCWDRCIGCLSKINVNSKALTVYSTLYGFLRCQYMSSCKETHTEGYSNIKGIVQCDFISSTTGINGGSNTHVGNSCSIA